MITLDPLRDRVIVKKHAVESTTGAEKLIELPDVCKDPPMTGDVIAVGPGRITPYGARLPMDVKPGDRVLFPRYEGNNVTVDGEEFFVIREDKILLVY